MNRGEIMNWKQYRWTAGILPVLALLAGCNRSENGHRAAEAFNLMNVAQEPVPPQASPPILPENGTPVTLPQIAYSYRYGFLVPDGAIEATQKLHLAACERMGRVGCQIVTMSRSDDGETQSGQLIVNVDATRARRFSAELEASVAGKGGEMTESAISAEDLSRQIIDTDARVKAKALLAQRLTELLATRKGTTADLVTAERALSDVQQELDSARTQLKDMKGRVAMSDITISYSTRPVTTDGFMTPLQTALSSAGKTLGDSLATLMHVLIAVLPWALALFGGIKLYRRLGGRFPRLRWPWRRKTAAED